jgi:RNA polymerase sigma factor (sigma-70 family)
MATGQCNSVIQHLRRTGFLQEGAEMTDAQLLERFLAQQEEEVFETLLTRHGPMVLGVCRRLLNNAHDAEDAFQATFLVLIRKAAALRQRPTIGNWLYGVAYNTALKARAAAALRRAREAQVREVSLSEARTEDTLENWQPLLDDELSRLPDKFREPVVLCDIQGLTRKEAARQLGVAEGTLSGRLTTARRRLAKRLARHGVTLSAGALATCLCENAAAACVPRALLTSTAKAAALCAAGKTATAVASVQVAALTEGVLKTMLLSKLKTVAAYVAVVGILAAGGGILAERSQSDKEASPTLAAAEEPKAQRTKDREPAKKNAPEPRAKPKEGPTLLGSLQSIDVNQNSITFSTSSRTEGNAIHTFVLEKETKILRDGKEAKLADLKKNERVRVTLAADQLSVLSVSQTGASTIVSVKSIDVEKSTLTVAVVGRQGIQDKVYQIAKDAQFTLDGKPAKLGEFKEDMAIVITMSSSDANLVMQVQSLVRRTREKND